MNRRSLIRFFLALSFQMALIIAIPSVAIYTHLTGEKVILQTVPVDPYDFLRGYSQTLRYQISRLDHIKRLSGWETVLRQTRRRDESLPPRGTTVYVILQAPASPRPSPRPSPWSAIAVRHEPPVNLGDNQVAIKGQLNGSWIDYGLERYYFPEQQRQKINEEIRMLQQNNDQERPFVVEVKVDEGGNAVPVSLWLGSKNYRF